MRQFKAIFALLRSLVCCVIIATKSGWPSTPPLEGIDSADRSWQELCIFFPPLPVFVLPLVMWSSKTLCLWEYITWNCIYIHLILLYENILPTSVAWVMSAHFLVLILLWLNALGHLNRWSHGGCAVGQWFPSWSSGVLLQELNSSTKCKTSSMS